ncbi:BUD3 [Candida metapsilosis]|uniref:BUD3 n=1 Tax=Candida metapsilosis TaxID=273372 RepID=A0A8H7ZA18_9ASCO|nr:BUD3 [Candida metapsilosis]
MSLYTRYVSGEHDKEHFKSKQPESDADGIIAKNNIQLPFFNDDLDDGTLLPTDQHKQLLRWLKIFHRAAIFVGYDDVLFNYVVSIVYQSANKKKLSAQSITKFGPALYTDLKLDPDSRFWPSCENLLPQHQKSHVRQALAISNLKNSNKILNHHHSMNLPMWDETNAGALASAMALVQNKSPDEVGKKLIELGLVQNHSICSFTVDVIYDNDSAKEVIVEENNRLVTLLGDQLDQIFNPLLEYAPEEIKTGYSPSTDRKLVNFQDPKIHSILEELINVQTNYTAGLVNLLQSFIVPLRVSVLERDRINSTSTIQKVNQILPPTIDEIARVNCLLNDALLKARKVDDIEVIVAMGSILPYFYKPFIRHEANAKNFYQSLTKFAQKNRSSIFENSEINPTQYTVREIDSIVTGALLELPKFKLLLQRLHESIELEKTQSSILIKDGGNDTINLIDENYKSAMDVIYAFSGADEQKIEAKGRIFTPTGRMLTELADNWPPELQLDWNTRKIVGIFELQNVVPRAHESGSELLVVFSDYLLFFSVEGNNHEGDNDKRRKLSAADVLMHSLINEKPMPNLDDFPKMQVKAWCSIDEVLVTKYLALDNKNLNIECLRFLSLNSGGFRSTDNGARVFTRCLKITGERAQAEDIIVSIEKSKVLHKSSSFHLFKSLNKDTHISYTAQSVSDYKTETFKSPFALVLNMDIDMPSYFEEHPQLVLLLQASMANDSEVKVIGYDKYANKQINETIGSSHFASFIEHMSEEAYHHLFSTYNRVTHNLIEGNSSNLKYMVNQFLIDKNNTDKHRLTTPKSAPGSQHNGKPASHPEQPQMKSLSSRSSILSKLYLKKSKKSTKQTHHSKSNQRLEKKISNTFIPQGTKLEYKEIYKPVPILQQRQNSSASTVIENKPDIPAVPVSREQVKVPATATVNTSKRCPSVPSIEVSPNFQFPHPDNNLDEIETDEIVPSTDYETSTIKRLSTMDDISMLLKISQDPSSGDYIYDDFDKTPNWEFFNAESESDMLPNQEGYIGDLIEVAEEGEENGKLNDDHHHVHDSKGVSGGAINHQEHQSSARTRSSRLLWAPPVPSLIENSAGSRKPSNESSIFSHAGQSPILSHGFPTPPMPSNQEGTFSARKVHNPKHSTKNAKSKSRLVREESIRSITAHEYAMELSHLIDTEFSKPPLEDAIRSFSGTARRQVAPSPSTATNTSSPATLTPFHTNNSVITLVSTSFDTDKEEEQQHFFDSSGEPVVTGQAQQVLHKELKGTQETLISKYDPKSMPMSETSTKPLSEYMRDDSISQLANLLRSSIKFSDFDVEKLF